MCKLVVANKPTRENIIALAEDMCDQPHGYGFVLFHEDGIASFFKTLNEERFLKVLNEVMKKSETGTVAPVRFAIVHTRISTGGEIDWGNAQPIWLDENKIIAHNGWISEFSESTMYYQTYQDYHPYYDVYHGKSRKSAKKKKKKKKQFVIYQKEFREALEFVAHYYRKAYDALNPNNTLPKDYFSKVAIPEVLEVGSVRDILEHEEVFLAELELSGIDLTSAIYNTLLDFYEVDEFEMLNKLLVILEHVRRGTKTKRDLVELYRAYTSKHVTDVKTDFLESLYRRSFNKLYDEAKGFGLVDVDDIVPESKFKYTEGRSDTWMFLDNFPEISDDLPSSIAIVDDYVNETGFSGFAIVWLKDKQKFIYLIHKTTYFYGQAWNDDAEFYLCSWDASDVLEGLNTFSVGGDVDTTERLFPKEVEFQMVSVTGNYIIEAPEVSFIEDLSKQGLDDVKVTRKNQSIKHDRVSGGRRKTTKVDFKDYYYDGWYHYPL